MIDALFGSKTRVKLLHLFLNNPNRSFYVREITRKIDEQINSVRRELANMLSIGIIQSDSTDNKLYYEVNQKYPYYAPLRQIFADSQLESVAAASVEANDWAHRLRALGDVKVALLSGGFVKNSLSPVDILLVGSLNKNAVKKFIKELESDEGRPLNFTVMPYEDFYYRMSVKDRFIVEILSGKFTVLQDAENVFNS
ncbi:MAG TPA: transcriptional regulator [Candidatus Saccharimonadales bacterium]